ncbi:Signal recognition particle subunit SRP72 [Colletotrichum spinosum]|uniref:Signal recognition particle subunit SRP72 n=1 Tax=Colletotrichum spinosum TaxID=1347390 RepID=A0A4V3HQZ1_9PEZI|nr:Signal recognition particle subunit SRP72 [Colletotrichum spinosum]
MPSSDPAVNLSNLLRSASIDDHEEVLKAANASLRLSKDDLTAQRIRVVALLKLDRFDEALRAIADGGDRLEDACLLAKAYALYKAGNLHEAGEIARTRPHRSFRHVAAQIAYRDEDFNDAYELYKEMLKTPHREENDITINLLASLAQMEWKAANDIDLDTAPNTAKVEVDTFELLYNVACGCIARGQLTAAMALLQRALRLCDESEDLTDDEKQAEMVPIIVQQAYVYCRLGKLDESNEILKRLFLSDIWDTESKLIALNNKSALVAEVRNPYLAQRELDSALTLSKNAKLFQHQESQLGQNRYILGLHAHKFDGIFASTSKLLVVSSPTICTDMNSLSAINATAWALRRSHFIDVKEIVQLLDRRPVDVGLLLSIVQLYLSSNNPGAALSVLETSLQNLEKHGASQVRFAPGLVALTVSLYRQQGRQSSVRSELAKASSFWEKRDGRPVDSLLRSAGFELLQSSYLNDHATAGAAFEKLCRKTEADSVAAAGLVAAFAASDSAKVESHNKNLPSVDSLIGNIDADRLVAGGVATFAMPASQVKKRRLEPTDITARRKRKRKLPKDFEEGREVDPERWLPLRDRSSYRPKGKKGKKKATEATQGGFVKEEILELAGGAGSVKVERAPMSSSHKKKKKGKK